MLTTKFILKRIVLANAIKKNIVCTIAQSHTHLQFAPANATPKIAKEYLLPTLNPY